MGWSSGVTLFSSLVEIIKETVMDRDERQDLYDKMIDCFEEADCDNLSDLLPCNDEELREILRERYPSDDAEWEDDEIEWDDD